MNIKKTLIASTILVTVSSPILSIVSAEEGEQTRNTTGASVTSSMMKGIIFTDVPENHWAHDSIYALVDLGYVAGYPDGTYGINKDVTRGEAASILARWMRDEGNIAEEGTYDNPFTDVPSSYWATNDILAVVDAGYMTGKGDGVFDPYATVTRAEMATILVNVVGTETKADYQFYDVPDAFWASEYIKNAYSNGLVNGMGDYKYEPNGKVSRAQYAQFIMNGINFDEDFVPEPIPPEEITPPVVTPSDDFYDEPWVDDVYDVYTDDLLVPTESIWTKLIAHNSFYKILSEDGLKVIHDVNEKYGTKFQIIGLQGYIAIEDTNMDNPNTIRFMVPRMDQGEGFVTDYMFTDIGASELVEGLVNVIDTTLYSGISEGLDIAEEKFYEYQELDHLKGWVQTYDTPNYTAELSTLGGNNMVEGDISILATEK